MVRLDNIWGAAWDSLQNAVIAEVIETVVASSNPHDLGRAYGKKGIESRGQQKIEAAAQEG